MSPLFPHSVKAQTTGETRETSLTFEWLTEWHAQFLLVCVFFHPLTSHIVLVGVVDLLDPAVAEGQLPHPVDSAVNT